LPNVALSFSPNTLATVALMLASTSFAEQPVLARTSSMYASRIAVTMLSPRETTLNSPRYQASSFLVAAASFSTCDAFAPRPL
jgi:hypothetical protein